MGGTAADAVIYHGRYVVPLDPELAPAADAGVLVVDGRVVEIAPLAELRGRHQDARLVGGRDRVVMPGLVDAHQHGRPISPSARGVEDQELETWLLEQAAVPAPDPRLSAQVAGIRMLLAGITSAVHHHLAPQRGAAEHTLDAVRGYRDAGLRVRFGVDVRDRGTYTYDDDEKFLDSLPPGLAQDVRHATGPGLHVRRDDVESLLRDARHVAADSPIEIGLAVGGPQWCSDETLEWVAGLVADGTGLQSHCSETRAQYGHFAERGTSPVRHLAAHRLLGPRTQLAHCVWLDDRDLAVIAETGTNVAHNPGSNLRLAAGIAPVATLLAAGVQVGLGSDSGGTLSDRIDPFVGARLAARLQDLLRRGLHGTAGAQAPMSDAELFTAFMSTTWEVDGAPATLGRLTPGGPADLVLVDWAEITSHTPLVLLDELPERDVIRTLVSRAESTAVREVVVGGRHLVVDGVYQGADLAALEEELITDVGRVPIGPDRRRAVEAMRPYVAEATRRWTEEASAHTFIR